MKRMILGVVAALVVFAAGVGAQDAIFAFRGAFADTLVTNPCGANGLKGPASMTVYDRNAWIVYTCNDDRVALRRYFNPNDNAIGGTSNPAPKATSTIVNPLDYPAVDFTHLAQGAAVSGQPGSIWWHNGQGWTIR
jgi:hypothetical protein